MLIKEKAAIGFQYNKNKKFQNIFKNLDICLQNCRKFYAIQEKMKLRNLNILNLK